jgi:hypothetical protein
MHLLVVYFVIKTVMLEGNGVQVGNNVFPS